MKFLLILLILISHLKAAELETVNVNDLEGLIPSSWLDHTGFHFDDVPELKDDVVVDEDIIPLLPMYKSSGFGRKVYVGGVVEDSYLQGKSRSQISKILRKISETKTSEGIALAPYVNQGKIYGIRRDYRVEHVNSTSIGLSLSFGDSKSVNLGEIKRYGFSLEFNGGVQLHGKKGFNGLSMLQKMIDDWSGNLDQDQSQTIINQAVSITPVLMGYYLTRPQELHDSEGTILSSLPGEKNNPEERESSVDRIQQPRSHSPRWVRTMESLKENLSEELKWQRELVPQKKAENLYASPRAQNLVQDICNDLSAVFEIPTELWPRCRVAATLVPNAWAYPGGDVFITAGLLGVLKDVDSVTLVLAHEISHIVGRHGTRELRTRKNYVYAATYVSTAVNLGLVGLAASGGGGLLGNVTFLSWYPQALSILIGGNYLLEKSSELASLAPMAGVMLKSRDLEREADALGMEAAVKVGADPQKMTRGWEDYMAFMSRTFPKKSGIKELLLRNHPSMEERGRAFEAQAKRLQATILGDSETRQLREDNYHQLHRDLRIYAEAFGRMMKKRFETETSTKHSANKLRHFMHTVISSHGLCVQHALGGQ